MALKNKFSDASPSMSTLLISLPSINKFTCKYFRYFLCYNSLKIGSKDKTIKTEDDNNFLSIYQFKVYLRFDNEDQTHTH